MLRQQINNIVLIGMRGSGKTTTAHLLSKKINWPVIEVDQEIELTAKKTISEIVNQDGWDHFRKLEKKTVTKICQSNNSIISTGGGSILDPINRKNLQENNLVIYLSASTKVLASRLNSATNNRPALTAKISLLQELDEVFAERKYLYEELADLQIDTDQHQSANETADAVYKLLQAQHSL